MGASFPAYGLSIQSTFELPISGGPAAEDAPSLTLGLASSAEVAEAWSGTNGAPAWQTMFPGDCHVRFERGREGDFLLTFGRRAHFHLDRPGSRLLCAPADPGRLDWQRFLLETALCCASSVRGFEALHASAVRGPEGVVAFVATRGAGKSTLAAELVARGHALVCDDVLSLGRDGAEVIGHPGPPFMTLHARAAVDRDFCEVLEASTEDGTVWVRVRGAETDPTPLTSIFILEGHRSPDLRPIGESARPGRLLPHTLSLSREPARALSRLGLLRELAASVSLYSIGTRGADVADLADAIEQTWAGEGSDRTEPAAVDHASAA
jgi:hypothetical protein